MSSRPSGYYNSRGGGYRDRDAEAGPARRRSRSPDARESGPDQRNRDSDRTRHRDGDRDRDRDSSYRRRQDDDNEHRESNYRRDVKGKGRSRSPESTHQPQSRPTPRDGPPRQPSAAEPPRGAPAGGFQRNGPPHGFGAGGGRGGYQSFEQNRPLDRRAIEEGRRQREMERAMRAQKELGGEDPSRSVTRSPEPYRRPRNANGGHINPDGGSEQEGGESEGEDDAEAAAMAAMGFGGFGSTKGKHREGNAEGGANIKKERTWRQYMNRRGGFNRPLDAVKEKKK